MASISKTYCSLCRTLVTEQQPVSCGPKTKISKLIKKYLGILLPTNENGRIRLCGSCRLNVVEWDKFFKHICNVNNIHISLKVITEVRPTNQFYNWESSKEEDEDEPNKVKSPNRSKICLRIRRIGDVTVDSNLADPVASTIIVKNEDSECSSGNEQRFVSIPLEAITDLRNDCKKEELVELPDEELESKCNKENIDFEETTGCEINNVETEEEEEKTDTLNTAKEISNIKWECLECGLATGSWNALTRHAKDLHDCAPRVKCLCAKILFSRLSVIKHHLSHTVGLRYACEFKNCHKRFYRKSQLDVHVVSHLPKEEQPWLCCKCTRRFHSETLLKQHERMHLPKQNKTMFSCEICHKLMCSKSAVTAHVKAIHLGERPFVCDQCGLSFKSKGILGEHLTIHSDVFNYHCTDCGKSFKTKYRLRIHMDTHLKTRYSCPICDLTLNTRRTLRSHLLVHQDHRQFRCEVCSKTFKRSKDLKNHRNLHTGRKPYTCPFCARTFANGSNCRSHKRRMHPEQLKEYEAKIALSKVPPALSTEQNDEFRDESNLNILDVREVDDDIDEDLSESLTLHYPLHSVYAFPPLFSRPT